MLLNKRKTNPGTTPLLALAGVFGALITWVSISRPLLIHSRKTSLTGPPFPPLSALCLTACPHGCRPNSLRFQARPGSPRPRPLLRQRRFCVERNQDFPVPSHHDPLRCVHREFMFSVSVRILRLLIPALALPMLHRMGPQLCRDPAAVPGFPRRYRFVRLLAAVIDECPLIKSGIPGTGIAAVQGLSGLTKGDSVFIEKQERITKSFLSSTVAVNGLCTCSYLSPRLELHSPSPHLAL